MPLSEYYEADVIYCGYCKTITFRHLVCILSWPEPSTRHSKFLIEMSLMNLLGQ